MLPEMNSKSPGWQCLCNNYGSRNSDNSLYIWGNYLAAINSQTAKLLTGKWKEGETKIKKKNKIIKYI